MIHLELIDVWGVSMKKVSDLLSVITVIFFIFVLLWDNISGLSVISPVILSVIAVLLLIVFSIFLISELKKRQMKLEIRHYEMVLLIMVAIITILWR